VTARRSGRKKCILEIATGGISLVLCRADKEMQQGGENNIKKKTAVKEWGRY